MSDFFLLRRTRCFAFGLTAATAAALDWPYDAIRSILTEQPEGAILAIFAPYPTPGNRILGMAMGLVFTVAICWFGDRIPGRPLTKALFILAAAVVVALIVRSQGLSWAHEANLAFRRWILGLVGVVVAASTLAALAPTVWAKARSRRSTDH